MVLNRRLGAVIAVFAVVVMASWRAPVDAQTASIDITEADLREHLENLQAIADANGGNRAFDTPGYQASVDYVTSRLEAAGYTVSAEPFDVENAPIETGPSSFERTAPSPRTYIDGVDYLQPSPGSPVDASGQVVAVDDGGCNPDDWDGVPSGAIALVELGHCDAVQGIVLGTFLVEITGALVIPDAGPGTPPQPLDVGRIPFVEPVAVLSLSADAGAELAALVETDTVEVDIETGWEAGTITTTNVIAERPGTTGEVVMLGAHLDSVPAGPGINDDGSGVAAVLEIAEQVAEADVQTERGLRFGFWGAEEVAILGSKAYVESLTQAERDRIVAYLNADMIGSINGIRGVYDPAVFAEEHAAGGDDDDDEDVVPLLAPGSQAITDLFNEHFRSLGLPTQPVSTHGASDDISFTRAGIPIGGVYSGSLEVKTPEQAELFGGTAGEPLDPCYHLACDRLSNIDFVLASQMAQALGVVLVELAGAPVAPPPASETARPRLTG